MGEPVLVSLLFADKVIVEKGTEKKTLVGTFTRFNSSNFPVSFAPWFIYASVTNIAGDHNFSFILGHDQQKQVVFSMNGKLGSKSPKSVIEMSIPVINAVFPQAGDYTLEFNIDGKQVGARFLDVRAATDKPDGG